MRFLTEDYNFLRRDYWFGQVDPRPLGLFRIFFALLMLKVAVYFLCVADEFFSDAGLTPRSLMLEISPHHNRLSLMDGIGDAGMARVFFLLWVLILLLLLVGYRTRLMLILNFIVITSVNARSFLILSGADLVLRVLSFWLLFLPLGAAYSVDSHRQRRDGQAPRSVFALPLRLIQLQVALIYVFSFLIKLEGKPWRAGLALFYAFQIESHTLPSGAWILENAPLWALSLGTYLTLIVEGAFILLVFVPFFQPRLRAIGLLMGVMLHAGIALTMSIHDFSLAMVISYLLFLDPGWLTRKTFIAPPQRLSSLQKGLSVGLIMLMGCVIWWNLATLEPFKKPLVPDVSGLPRTIMQYLGLGQTWGMFAPYPSDSIGWVTVPARFENGLELDLMTTLPLSDQFTTYDWGPQARWKKYVSEVWRTRSGIILKAWADYYCRRYNEADALPQGTRLMSLDIVYNWRWAHKPNAERNPLIQTRLWQQTCPP